MRANAFDTDELLRRAADGDRGAVGELMNRHRQRLRRMVAVRLDARIVQRIDPSDVVQETLTEASQMLPLYLQARPLPFYPWLRQISFESPAPLRKLDSSIPADLETIVLTSMAREPHRRYETAQALAEDL